MTRYLLIATLLVSPVANAAPPTPPVYVYSHNENDRFKVCNLRSESALAAAQAELRTNNVEVTYADSEKVLKMYIMLNPIPISTEPRLVECTVSFNVNLNESILLKSRITGRAHIVEVQYCNVGSLAVLEISGMQQDINSVIKNAVDECLSDYGKSISN
jgi:hypothetical protein